MRYCHSQLTIPNSHLIRLFVIIDTITGNLVLAKQQTTSMDFELLYASPDHKYAIRNLMQFYIYDFSPYVDYDVEEDGMFKEYPGLEDYWTDQDNKFPYIIKKDGKYVGFVLVNKVKPENNYFSIAEFFIMKKYRRAG